ncbi:MAG: helix-turn-helix domain-containing protein [Firmicutes bacterium]|nr:helix-turn-helix domain-containing protein [Bacillota bacterium]
MSQGDLADKLGVSRQAISKWEREEGLPDLYNIKNLAKIFKVSVDELVMDGGNIIIDYRNKKSVVLMSIPMAIIFLGILVLLFFTVAYGVAIIGDIFTLGRMVLYNNLQWVLVPVGLMISIALLETFFNLLSNHKVNLSRLLSLILYSLVLAISLAALLEFEITGFSTIFLYIFGFIIISVGLVGVILFQTDIRLHTGIRDKKPVRITLKGLKAIALSYILIFALSATETYIFTKPLNYLYNYTSSSVDDSFYMHVSQDDSNTDIRHFSINIDYLVQLDQNIQNPYLKVYMSDNLIAEGILINSINGDYNYVFELEQNDYELPMILLDEEYSTPIEIKCVVTYELNSILNTETIFPSFRENRTVMGFAKAQNLWIWDYKDYIPE